MIHDSGDGISAQAKRRTIVLHTEDEAWELLKSVIAGKAEDIAYDIDCKDWDGFTLKAHLRYDQTITPPFMDAFQELQKAIYRTYALVQYDSTDARVLTDDEKVQLTISIKVESGSSKFSIANSEDIIEIIQDAVLKMTGDQVYNIALVVALLYFGRSVVQAILQHFLDKRKMELHATERLAELEGKNFATEEETERLRIIQQIASQSHIGTQVFEDILDIHRTFLKAIANNEGAATYAGMELTPTVASELSAMGRKEVSQGQANGIYTVKSIIAGKLGMFHVKLESVDNKNSGLTAQLPNDMLAMDSRELLQVALFQREPLAFKINIEKENGKIVRGHIISVAKVGANASDDNQE